MKASEALKLLGVTAMRPFTSSDFHGFAGVQSKEPLIGEAKAFVNGTEEELTLIVDGESFQIYTDENMVFSGVLGDG